jgi:hypothetical protein
LYGLLLKPRMYAMETRRGNPFEPAMIARLSRAVPAQEYAKVVRRGKRRSSVYTSFNCCARGVSSFTGNSHNN